MNEKWDRDFLALAEWWAKRKSKDPSTQVGCVIVRPDKTIASMGYNGFPRGIADTHERLHNREAKYPRMVHAEMNAIHAAYERLIDYTLYVWPPAVYSPTCDRCASSILQEGIVRVVGMTSKFAIPGRDYSGRWFDPCKRALEMYNEAGIEVKMYG